MGARPCCGLSVRLNAAVVITDTWAVRRQSHNVHDTSKARLNGSAADEDSGAGGEGSQAGAAFSFYCALFSSVLWHCLLDMGWWYHVCKTKDDQTTRFSCKKDLYSAPLWEACLRSAQVGSHSCYTANTPYLPLPRKHSPDGTTTV